MSATPASVVVPGIVKPDGTLEVQETVALPPGPVQVQVQRTAGQPQEDWWQYLQRCRAELEASGAVFRRSVDIASEIDQIRGEHDRIEGLYWEMEWQKHHPGSGTC